MKSRKAEPFLILVCFAVFSLPLLFFYRILGDSYVRNLDYTAGFLREKLLHNAARISENLKPEAYLKNTFAQIHADLLPGIVPEVADMHVQDDFGSNEFTPELPEVIWQALRNHSLEPLMVVVNPPGFNNAFFKASAELVEQCSELKQLAWTLTIKSVDYANRMFRQKNQKNWPGGPTVWTKLISIIGLDQNHMIYHYLTRYGEVMYYNDNLTYLFTDYFSRQVMYFYSFSCISRTNIHGSYSAVVLQSSIKSDRIVDSALSQNDKTINVSIDNSGKHSGGFDESAAGISYTFLPPTEFQNHLIFENRLTADKAARQQADTIKSVKLTAVWPSQVVDFAAIMHSVRFAIQIMLMFLILILFRLYLFGFGLPFLLKTKLRILTGLIIFIPVTGATLLLFSGIHDFERLIDYHVFRKTLNRLEEARIISDENHQRLLLTAVESRRRLENTDVSDNNNLFSWILNKDSRANWFVALNRRIMTCFSNGEKIYFSDIGLPLTLKNTVAESVITRYMQNLGLLEVQGSSGRMAFKKEDMALGFLEEYITPELEEKFAVHEGTLQREYFNTGDINIMCPMIIKRPDNSMVAAIQFVNNNNDLPFHYLTRFMAPAFGYFHRNERFSDISMSIRLRKTNQYDSYAWNLAPFSQNSAVESFNQASRSRAAGELEVRGEKSLTVNAWLFRNMRSDVLLAQGTKLFNHDMFLFAFAISGCLLVFSMILMIFLANYFSRFVNAPLEIIEKNVQKLQEGKLGINIQSFSSDEFNSITEAFNRMSTAVRQKEQMSRYVSDRLMNEVEAGNLASGFAPTIREMTVLSSDIRGFTTISEKFSPAEIVEMLNSYFTAMEEAIVSAGGVIEKYVGDAVSAVFFDGPAGQNSAVKACQAALNMRKALKLFNQERKNNGLFTIETGIGLVTDSAMSGTIGSHGGRKDYVIFGSIADRASLLESLTKNTCSRILVCEKSYAMARAGFKFKSFDTDKWELTVEESFE